MVKVNQVPEYPKFMVSGKAYESSREKGDQKSRVKGREKSREKILRLLQDQPDLTQTDLANALKLSVKAIEKNIRLLKDANLLRRIGPDKGGHWEVVKANPPRRGKEVRNETTENAKVVHRQAVAGDVCAMRRMASYCWTHPGPNGSHEEACRWIARAADEDDASACELMGWCMLMGDGVPRDRELAARYFLRAGSIFCNFSVPCA